MFVVKISIDQFIDCGTFVLRVHLFGHHVVSMVIFHPWPRARVDLDRDHRCVGPLHVPDHLVSNTEIVAENNKFNSIQGILHAPS